MEEKSTAEQDLHARIKIIRAISPSNQASVDAATARNILHEELGYFSDPQPNYNLDDATRNRLLVHARQDAAHAVLGVATLRNELWKLQRLVRIVVVLLVVLMLSVIVSLFFRA